MRVALWIIAFFGFAVLSAALTLRFLRAKHDTRIDEVRAELLATRPDDPAPFRQASIDDLPDAARRYLTHAIDDGTERRGAVDLSLSGEILLGEARWGELTGDHVIAPQAGYVWRVEIRQRKMRTRGAEILHHGKADARFWQQDFLPSGQEDGDLTRSARGRLAVDRIFCPFALLPDADVRWEEVDAERALAAFDVDGEDVEILFHVGADGSLISARSRVWGNVTDDRAYTHIPYGVEVLEERTFDGVTIPVRLSYTWWEGTDREVEFLRPIITGVTFPRGAGGG